MTDDLDEFGLISPSQAIKSNKRLKLKKLPVFIHDEAYYEVDGLEEAEKVDARTIGNKVHRQLEELLTSTQKEILAEAVLSPPYHDIAGYGNIANYGNIVNNVNSYSPVSSSSFSNDLYSSDFDSDDLYSAKLREIEATLGDPEDKELAKSLLMASRWGVKVDDDVIKRFEERFRNLENASGTSNNEIKEDLT